MQFKRSMKFLMLLAAVVSGGAAFVQAQPSIACGDVVESEVSVQEANEGHSYRLDLSAGDQITITAAPFSESTNVVIELFDPSGQRVEIENNTFRGAEVLDNFVIPASGEFEIRLSTSADVPFAYTLSIECVLRDPGSRPTAALAPTGLAFPDFASIDPAKLIELPLDVPAPIAGDTFVAYSFEASASAVQRLSVSRLSGDASIGVMVVNTGSNEVIFLGGMPSSNNLNVELTFPSDGSYVIVVFQLNTPQRSGTSGAVQVTLE